MNIVLTGASRGIGAEVAKRLCLKGIDSLILISRNENALKKLRKDCESVNDGVHIVTEAADLSLLTKSPEDFLSRLQIDQCDAIINNAGFLVNEKFDKLTDEQINKMIEVNLLSPARLIKIFCLFYKKLIRLML